MNSFANEDTDSNQPTSSSNWPKSTIIQTSIKDIAYIGLPKNDLIAQRLQKFGTFEPEVNLAAIGFLSGHSSGSIVDIGANIGSFTLPLAMQFPNFEFICFEAQRLVSYQLAGSVALNGLSNVFVRHAMVSDFQGKHTILVPDYAVETNIGALSLDSHINSLRGACTAGALEQVDVIKLDDLDSSNVRLLKIDVEGMELAVLKGGENLLRRFNFPPILFECWGADWFKKDREALLSWISDRGYEIQQMGDNFVATRKQTVTHV